MSGYSKVDLKKNLPQIIRRCEKLMEKKKKASCVRKYAVQAIGLICTVTAY